MSAEQTADTQTPLRRVKSDVPFFCVLIAIGGFYILIVVAMLVAEGTFTSPLYLIRALQSPEIRYSTKLSLVSCTITTILSLWVAVPIGYLMSRYEFRGKALVDSVLDIPIVLPPLVVGLCLLILFQSPVTVFAENILHWLEGPLQNAVNALASLLPNPLRPARPLRPRLTFPVTYAVPSVILAQFMVACAFAVRTMRVTFDQINPRQEQVALTLGCTRSQAFWLVVLPEARRGMVAAATLAWARALGEFGPILIFSGSTRMRTEVLPTSVFLELSVGNIEAAVAVSLFMVLAAVIVLVIVRISGLEKSMAKL